MSERKLAVLSPAGQIQRLSRKIRELMLENEGLRIENRRLYRIIDQMNTIIEAEREQPDRTAEEG